MSNGQSLLDTLVDAFASPHPDGYKFIGMAGAAAVVALLIGWGFLGLLGLSATAFVSYIFRDPDRVTPLREGLVLAAADGTVIAVETVTPPAELGFGSEQRMRVSTYLSLLDVHVNRAPVAGRVKRSVYVPGAFVDPMSEKAAEENERRAIVVAMADGSDVAVVQIAGGSARRITTFVSEGENVGVGQRFGLIRFSARVDLYLPPGKAAQVAVGQRMIAGETVVSDLRSAEGQREARRI